MPSLWFPYGDTSMDPEAPVPAQRLDDLSPKERNQRIVEDLIAKLRVPEPAAPRTPVWAKILGVIGDALNARAVTLRGGTPGEGSFGRHMRAQQEQYANALQAARGANLETAGRLRIGAFEEGLRREREESVAKMRQQGRPLRFIPNTVDIGGKPIRVTDVYDSTTGEFLGRNVAGEAGYAPFIQPAIPGVSGPVRIPRVGPTGPVGGVTPPLPPGPARELAGDVATLQGLDILRGAYSTINADTRGKGGFWDKAKQVAGTLMGETRFGGLSKFSKPYAQYVAAKRASLNAYIKSVTGAQFSVKELERYDSQYPEPWDPEDLANDKLRALAQRSVSDMQVKLGLYPAAAGAAQAGMKPPGSAGKAAGMVLPASAFEDIPEELREREKQRFRDDGGTIQEDR